MSALPDWDAMSDLDKGAALMHLHKREHEGGSYAVEHYPARYLDDPRLIALSTREASRHAVQLDADADALSADEYERLYDLALAEPERRMLWAARAENGRVIPTDTCEKAVELITVSWPKYQPDVDLSKCGLLRRGVPGGEWFEVDFERVTA